MLCETYERNDSGVVTAERPTPAWLKTAGPIHQTLYFSGLVPSPILQEHLERVPLPSQVVQPDERSIAQEGAAPGLSHSYALVLDTSQQLWVEAPAPSRGGADITSIKSKNDMGFD